MGSKTMQVKAAESPSVAAAAYFSQQCGLKGSSHRGRIFGNGVGLEVAHYEILHETRVFIGVLNNPKAII